MTQSRLESILSAVLTLAALTVAGLLVRREFFTAPAANAQGAPATAVQYVASWKDEPLLRGSSQSAVTIVEFFDVECPACRTFHSRVKKEVDREFGARISWTFVHLPLSIHRFAPVGARAAECARSRGRFGEFIETVYEGQDSLGLKPWSRYASAAGIADTAGFDSCAAATTPVPQLDASASLVKRLEVNATPTIIVNGWRFARPPSAADLSQTIRDLEAGKEPSFAAKLDK